MKNASLNCLHSLCPFGFLKSEDLRKSSLNRQSKNQYEQPELKLNLSVPQGKNDMSISRLSNRQDSRRELETPLARNEKEKTAITEKDFRIMQVSFLFERKLKRIGDKIGKELQDIFSEKGK